MAELFGSRDLVPAIEASLPERYRQWNRALLEALFPVGRVGSRVRLNVYDGLLDELGPAIGLRGSARDDFVASVLSLSPSNPAALWTEVSRVATTWYRTSPTEPPPCVAALGFAVLAATEMRTDADSTQANYYRRLNDLMSLPPLSPGPPRDFHETWLMWRWLSEWLKKSRRGELAVHGLNGARPYVDPVKSQCLVRECDLEDLDDVLREISFQAGTETPVDKVARFLGRWLRGPGATSRLARIFGRQPDEESLLQAAEALLDTAESALERGAEFQAAATREGAGCEAFLCIEPYALPSLRWRRASWCLGVLANPEDDSFETVILVDGEPVAATLDHREPPQYLSRLPHTLIPRILAGRADVEFGGSRYDVSGQEPYWFSDATEYGRPGIWEATRSLETNREYVVIVSPARFSQFLRAVTGWLQEGTAPAEIIGAQDHWPGRGLVAIAGVRLREGADVPGAASPVIAGHEVLRLVGGLSLRRHVYLRGALPRIEVPKGASVEVKAEPAGTPCAAVQDGQLNEAGLGEGAFRASWDSAHVSFAVTDPRWGECQAPPDIALEPALQAGLVSGTVRGAMVIGARERSLIHVAPGQRLRVYAPALQKIHAPLELGIVEVELPGPLRWIDVVPSAGRRPAFTPYHVDLAGSVADEGMASPVESPGSARLDQLLHFISARASGPVDLLRAVCQEVAGVGQPWHVVLALLEALGHVGIDWRARRWSAAPPMLCRRSSDPQMAFLAGLRTRDLPNRIQEAGLAGMSPDPRRLMATREPAPECWMLRETVRGGLTTLASRLGLELPDGPSADELAGQLKPVGDTGWWTGAEFWPASRAADTLEEWDPGELRWRPAELQRRHSTDLQLRTEALYRWKEGGRRVHAVTLSGQPRAVLDPAAAKWYLGRIGPSLLRYSISARALAVPAALGLPRLYYRAAALASGLAPSRSGFRQVFDDVSVDLARRLATRLLQPKAEGLF